MDLLVTDVTVGDRPGRAVAMLDGRIAWLGSAADAPSADRVVVADATDPLAVAAAVGTPVDVTVVCVDVQGAEHGAVLATRDGGTVVFFSMATSFSAAALGAEGMAADVTMLVGNGYTPGHAALAIELYRRTPGVRALIDPRVHL